MVLQDIDCSMLDEFLHALHAPSREQKLDETMSAVTHVILVILCRVESSCLANDGNNVVDDASQRQCLHQTHHVG